MTEMGNAKLLCRAVEVTERLSESHVSLATTDEVREFIRMMSDDPAWWWNITLHDLNYHEFRSRLRSEEADTYVNGVIAELLQHPPRQVFIRKAGGGSPIYWDGEKFIVTISRPDHLYGSVREWWKGAQHELGEIEIVLTLRQRELPLLTGLLGPLAGFGFRPRDERVYREMPLLQRQVAAPLVFQHDGHQGFYNLLHLTHEHFALAIAIDEPSQWFISRPDAIKAGKGCPACVRLTIYRYEQLKPLREMMLNHLPDAALARKTAEGIVRMYEQLTV